MKADALIGDLEIETHLRWELRHYEHLLYLDRYLRSTGKPPIFAHPRDRQAALLIRDRLRQLFAGIARKGLG